MTVKPERWCKPMTLGSLFDGSGGFPLAGALAGIRPVWAAEVEPYPIAVTRSRFPQMVHLGDVAKIDGAQIPPVGVITFGSPCQDMSMSGKRAGMKHKGHGADKTTRSGLFYEAIRIIREMREATHGEYPTFAVWENVPGAFSINQGEDFRCVLEEFINICGDEVSVPRPAGGKWSVAGEIVGDGFSVAWRTLDAQYWGVPQRRRRIYLVADFAGERAGKILFERDGLRGHLAASGETREETAGDAGGGASGSTGESASRCDLAGRLKDDGVVYSIQGNVIDRPDGARCNGSGWCEGATFTLNTIDRPAVAFMAGQGAKAGSIAASVERSPTLRAADSGTNQTPSVVYPAVAHALKAEGADGSPCVDGRGQNVVVVPNVFHTLTAANCRNVESAQRPNCVCYAQKKFGEYEDAVGTLTSDPRAAKSSGNIVCMATGQANAEIEQGLSPTLLHGHEHTIVAHERSSPGRRYIVRRLTPLECCRLQGFPDGWGEIDRKDSFTDDEVRFWQGVLAAHAVVNGKAYKPRKPEALLKWYNGLHTDSAEYRMWGNGIALPCAAFVLAGVAEALKGDLQCLE